jgi:vacuolar-type H+-ATPase subunit F/Vma7
MIRLAYVGDALTARAFALAGSYALVPVGEAQAVWDSLTDARARADLVVLSQAHAEIVRPRLEALLLADPVPPVVTLPDFSGNLAAERDAVGLACRLLGVAL